jgi:hypothetical protein
MLRPLLQWFATNLESPDDVTPRAVFWFKSDARPCIGRIWEVIYVLTSHDRIVWMSRSENPGKIVYQDRHQVAVVPHADRRWRGRPV